MMPARRQTSRTIRIFRAFSLLSPTMLSSFPFLRPEPFLQAQRLKHPYLNNFSDRRKNSCNRRSSPASTKTNKIVRGSTSPVIPALDAGGRGDVSFGIPTAIDTATTFMDNVSELYVALTGDQCAKSTSVPSFPKDGGALKLGDDLFRFRSSIFTDSFSIFRYSVRQ